MMTETPDCPMPDSEGVEADSRLIAEGWTRRFLADADRAAEALELYRAMGLEARAEKPAPADLGERCASCADAVCRSYLMVYTRTPGGSR